MVCKHKHMENKHIVYKHMVHKTRVFHTRCARQGLGKTFVSAKLPQGEEEGKKEVDEEQGEEGKNKEGEFILSLMLIKRLI